MVNYESAYDYVIHGLPVPAELVTPVVTTLVPKNAVPDLLRGTGFEPTTVMGMVNSLTADNFLGKP
ncbi:hypothetical protein A3A66_02690 [Microgenomates group bacterium RIFCSPLOWO2_01_FULL_46_13]|nr:MAG: hypothetical protein A2783_03055 [Microgenomates group bacterium RIFCSPHIGHO2_01_FULL_45_11]OGV94877.1 MAG: hypothetical protein A3A66_02690 [Microgenomates group bacterium RIFCSPLOWO2_01_FULL_46_13]